MSSENIHMKKNGVITSELLQKEVFAEIIATMSDGVMLIDNAGTITLHNSALSNILEVSPTDLINKGWAEIFLLNEKNLEFNDMVIEVIQKDLYYHHKQVNYYTPDDRKKTLLVTSSLLGKHENNGENEELLVVVQDITELTTLMERNIELYKERIESLENLSKSVAHIIRNPLMAIGGMVDRVLKKGSNQPWVDEYLHRVLLDCQRLENVVKAVKDFASVSIVKFEDIALPDLCAELFSEQEPVFSKTGLRLITEAPEDQTEPLLVKGKRDLLKQALCIILDNAREASPEHGSVYLRLLSETSNIRIEIADMGDGINPEDMQFIFDPFNSSKASGVGMNLAIAKRIVQAHNGLLEAGNRPEGGAVFSLILPKSG